MSHIGIVPIPLPKDIQFKLFENKLLIKGKFGTIELLLKDDIHLSFSKKNLYVTSFNKQLWGTTRTLIKNAIVGVSQGNTIRLKLVGLGYKASIEDNNLILKIGFSHSVVVPVPKNMEITCIKPTLISIFGFDKQKVHQFASVLRNLRKPDAYKGKGIRYENEVVSLKEKKTK